MTWQPIETAPQDGTDVLLYVPRPSWYPELAQPPVQVVGHWSHNSWIVSHVEGCEWNDPLIDYVPTLWKPLDWPTAPE